MNKRTVCFTVLSVLATHALWAQSHMVDGKITDKDSSKPISGVTVRNLSNNNTVVTDTNGNFKISAQSGDKIEATFIGFTTQFTKWDGSSTLSLALELDNKNIHEVVVTGYGTTNKKAFTGSAAIIDRDKMKDLQATSIGDILQGNASGVLAISNSGQPGEDPMIRIRGIGSENASSSPLILLDGAPYDGSLNSINPSDIESLTILKDASSTSIYGSRAANGIINITTRKGKGKPKFDLTYLTGSSSRAVKEYETVDAKQY